ncbi:MAG: anion permease, partial [Selenomonas sp.]|nr:anion permease [Selenomonas sp.]
NAWIRAHGLGRESVSAIYFPKCMEYVATRIGIIMAGSAWVGLEDLMGKERIAFVIRDSGCKAVFDQEKWSEAMQGIEWGTLILFGGGLAMGGMMYKTGLSQWVGDLIVSSMGGAPSEVAMVAIFSVMALLLSELTSHTAATNMIGPLAITAAISAGISPVPVSVGIALSASLGFMLPVSTPPNAIVYASGYIPITKMIKTGVYIDFIGIACVTIPLAIYFVNWIVG